MKCIIIFILIIIASNVYSQEFSKSRLGDYMDSIGIKYIYFSIGQAIHETNNFKSDVFLKNNNLFGMRVPVNRETTAIGKRKGYAVYNSWEDSVEDFKLMQDRILIKHKTYSSYLSYIFRNYAKDPNYKKKLKKYIE